MRPRVRHSALMLGSAALLVALVPAIAQKGPQSILPPGFGEPDAPPPPRDQPEQSDAPARPPGPIADEQAGVPKTDAPLTDDASSLAALGIEESNDASDNAMVAEPPQDLPPQARRSLDRVGLLAPDDGGFAPSLFGSADGAFLSAVMDRTRAPIASRWLSILLRRVLLSQSDVPAGVDAADWVGHRAWMLVRMGEAANARALVQRVDAENYTPWLYDVAMQAALASADPGALCGLADAAAAQSDKPSWTLARAMCAGLAGEGASASSMVSEARASRRAGGIDVLLAEKVVGVGSNTRRAITIQWDAVDQLTAWRYGLAAATGVAIPDNLYATVGPQVRAWAAYAPLTPIENRAAFVDRAATLGVLSSAALVDFYGSLYDAADPADRGTSVSETLRRGYIGDAAGRVSALKTLWVASGNPFTDYARQILTARAAGMLPSDAALAGDDLDYAVAAMFSAGLDTQAARWASAAKGGSVAWAMIATGAPKSPFEISAGDVSGMASANAQRASLLYAGLAGLGRLGPADVASLGETLSIDLGRQDKWTAALDAAVEAQQPGTVVLLCAAGMQSNRWAAVPPAYLYKIVDALRRVGLEPMARMIAAEAVGRT